MAAVAVTATAVIPSANASYIQSGTSQPTRAFEALTAGDIVYARTDTSEGYGLCSCTGVAPICHPVGMAVNNAAAGQPVSIITKDPNLTTNAVLVIGTVYVTGPTPGDFHANVDSTTGWKKSTIGIGRSTTTMSFELSSQESPAM